MRLGRAVAAVAIAIVIGSCVNDVAPPDVISPPTNVTVTLVGPGSARITWTAPPEAAYVDSYNVLRDGVKIAETIVTSYQDNNLLQGVTYKYRVSANGQIGIPGELSAETVTSAITIPDITAPTITSATPAAGATGIASNATVSVTFSEPMDAATISTTTFFLKTSGGALIPGAVGYTAATRTAVFTPTSALPSSTSLTANVTTGAKDAAGNGLATIFSLSFTTRDEIPPNLVSTSPDNGATGIPVTTAITVTFSEGMNPGTINTSSVLLKLTSSGASVAGTVNYNSTTLTATLNPSEQLSFGTGYTVIVTTDAKDVAGNSLAAGFSSAFTTAGAPDTTPPTVISVTPTNGSVGVGISVAASVTFSEAMDPTTINTSTVTLRNSATLALIPATVSYNATTNTATLAPTSSLSFATAYTITVGTGTKDLSGNALASGFTSTFTTVGGPDVTPPTVLSTVPANGATNVAVLTPITVTFSEPMNPATINTSTIVLKVTSTSAVVSGSVSYDGPSNTATFTPTAGTLAFGIGYTLGLSGAADVAGNAMAAPFSAAFTTIAAPDTTPPTVTATSPLNGATGVALGVAPTVTFSEPMNASTISGSTIGLRVTSSGVAIPGSVSYNAGTNTATFTPSSQLAFSTSYTLSVTTGVQDAAGNAMASPFSASFTTVPNPDTTRPTVISFVRLGSTGPLLENRSIVSVTFSEAMNPSTINASTVLLYPNVLNAPAVAGTVTYNSSTNTATFAASSPLQYVASGGPTYVLVVTTGVADLAGNTLASEFDATMSRVSYFQGTTEPNDNTKPQIHMHVTFSQSGQTLGLAAECQRLPAADCDLLGPNAAGAAAIGPYDDNGGSGPPVAATITQLTGTFSNPGITFTITLMNGRTFTFNGTMTDANTMTGTLSGATLSAPVAVTLAR